MPNSDFAKTSVLELIVRQLKKTAPGLENTLNAPIDTIRKGTVSADLKRKLIELLWRNGGPEAVLTAGQRITEITHDPLWYSALRSQSPNHLFCNWSRFELYAHSNNRLKIERIEQRRYRFERYGLSGEKPTDAENFLICGLLIAILERIGCIDLRCNLKHRNGQTALYLNKEFLVSSEMIKQDTSCWELVWTDFLPAYESLTSAYDLPQLPLHKGLTERETRAVTRVAQLMMQDISRQWKVSEIAEAVSLSSRSLQRMLSRIGLTFSQFVRLFRIHESCRLLRDTDMPVTLVGFCTGFSDGAHFSRDFRMSMGMSPSEYRRTCQYG